MATLLFLLLHGCVLKLVIARLDLTVTSSACGSSYDMEHIQEEAYVVYNGAWLDNTDCIMKFTNYQVYSKQTCIKPINFKMGCTTEVEYHSGFVSKYLPPEKLLTCRNASYDEWCGPMRTTNFNLLFRTSGGSSSDNITMHLYLQYYPGTGPEKSASDSSFNTTGLVIGVVVSIFMLIVLLGSLIACVVVQRRRSMQSFPRTPYVCQTAGAQTGQGFISQSQTTTGYNPTQQSQLQPTVQGGYQFHPVQSAYPVSQQPGYNPMRNDQPVTQSVMGSQSPADIQGRFQNPPAPPNSSVDTPPSYESLPK